MKRSICTDCAVDVYKTDGVYMLKDSTWSLTGMSAKGFLCISCVEKRIGRTLVKQDFNNSYVNKRNYGEKSMRLAEKLGLVMN